MTVKKEVYCPWCCEFIELRRLFASHVQKCPGAPASVKGAYLDPLPYPMPREGTKRSS